MRVGLVGEEQSQIWLVQRRFDLVVRLRDPDFAGISIEQHKAKLFGALTETAERARALLCIVGVRTWIPMRKLALERTVDQDGELAHRGR